jgi:rRNA processing protein Krr1/Pno1
MTFTSDNSWIWRHPKYIEAIDRVMAASMALQCLEDEMYVFERIPPDLEKIAEQKANFEAAKTARREVLLQLMNEHSKGE